MEKAFERSDRVVSFSSRTVKIINWKRNYLIFMRLDICNICNIGCPKKVFQRPIKMLRMSKKESYIWIKLNKTNNFWKSFYWTKKRFLGQPISSSIILNILPSSRWTFSRITFYQKSSSGTTKRCQVYLIFHLGNKAYFLGQRNVYFYPLVMYIPLISHWYLASS